MNEWTGMVAFVQVVRSGSFSAAARNLGTTQPSVSRRVHALETRLGASLFMRTTRSVALTDAGARYFDAACRALDALDEAREVAAAATATVRGTLRIAAPWSFSVAWLAPRLAAFAEAHPQVELVLQLSEVHVDLVGAGVDLAVRIGGPESAEVKGLRLGRVERKLVASRSWVEAHGLPAHPDDLADASGLVFAHDARWTGWPLVFEGRQLVLRVRPRLRAASGDFLRVMVRDGLGVALLPDWLVDDDLRRGDLVQLLPSAEIEPLDLWLLWPEQRYQSAAARSFATWFAERAREDASGRRPARGAPRRRRPESA